MKVMIFLCIDREKVVVCVWVAATSYLSQNGYGTHKKIIICLIEINAIIITNI